MDKRRGDAINAIVVVAEVARGLKNSLRSIL
jgi:hypothetical protein